MRQAGVIPWRSVGPNVEVLLVTSRTTGHWVVPKGMIEDELGPAGSAEEEAWEEAGAYGELHPVPVGAYRYEKYGLVHEVTLFSLRVDELRRDYPEADERERVWVPLSRAAAEVGPEDLARLFDELDEAILCRRPPLPIRWVGDVVKDGPQVGVCSLPGERPASLADDLAALRATGVTHLLCLVQSDELRLLEPPETIEERDQTVVDAGLTFLHLPVEDFTAPSLPQLAEALAFVEQGIAADGKVVVHCWAGLGRAGTVLACWLVSRGMRADDAIVTTRWVRPGAIQSSVQEAQIRRFGDAAKP